MYRAVATAMVAVAIVFALVEAAPVLAAVPQRAWTEPEACQSPGGPQNIKPATLFYDASGPGAYVNGNYISFVCNYGFERTSPAGRTAGVAVTVEYCGGAVQAAKRETGNYTTYAGQFTVRQQRWLLQNGALVVIVLYTNAHGGVDDFTTQEMVTGSQNLADLNRPQGAVPCPGGGTTENPGGGNGQGGWSISLSADATNLVAGNDFTLTATANKNTSGTGYAIFIVNQTDDEIVYCQNVAICTYKDFNNDPGSRTYQAFVANLQGQDTQAASNSVAVQWKAWTGTVSLTASEQEPDAGDVVHLVATASPTINASVYMIRIERTDNGFGGNCLESPCDKTDTYDAGVSYTYVAKVLKNDGTDLRATSNPVTVTWKATEEWSGKVFIRTAGGIDKVRPGVRVVMEAQAVPPLTNTDLVMKIFEVEGAGQSATCEDSTAVRCTMVVQSQQATTRIYNAVVLKRDGSGGTKAAAGELVSVTWDPAGRLFACEDGWVADDVTGTATVLIGDTERVPLKKGDVICPKDTVETGADGNITGHYEERGLFNPRSGPEVSYNAEVKVKPNTQLSLDFFDQGVTYSYFDMRAGSAEYFVDGIARSDFRIKSPTSVASVRGTRFSVEVTPGSGKTTVRSYEHEVLVTPTNPSLSPVSIFGGQQVTIETGAKSAVTSFITPLGNKRRLPALTREGLN